MQYMSRQMIEENTEVCISFIWEDSNDDQHNMQQDIGEIWPPIFALTFRFFAHYIACSTRNRTANRIRYAYKCNQKKKKNANYFHCELSNTRVHSLFRNIRLWIIMAANCCRLSNQLYYHRFCCCFACNKSHSNPVERPNCLIQYYSVQFQFFCLWRENESR